MGVRCQHRVQDPAALSRQSLSHGCSHYPLRVLDPELNFQYQGVGSFWDLSHGLFLQHTTALECCPGHAVKSWVARLKTLLSMDLCHLPQFLLISAWTCTNPTGGAGTQRHRQHQTEGTGGAGGGGTVPHVALGQPRGVPMPAVVPRVGVGTHTHLPIEETVEQSHQEALERTGRTISSQRKGLDPSVLMFSLPLPPPTPLSHPGQSQSVPGSPGTTLVPCPRCLGAPSPKRGQSPTSQGLLVAFEGAPWGLFLPISPGRSREPARSRAGHPRPRARGRVQTPRSAPRRGG